MVRINVGIFKKPVFKWNKRNKRRALHAGALIAAGGLFILVIALVQPFYTFNLWFSDRFVATGHVSPNIVIAGIDDSSLSRYGKWSDWPRSLHAQAVNNLEAAGATVIGYDVIFADNSNNDQAFISSLQKGGNVVLAGAGTTRLAVKNAPPTYTQFLMPAAALFLASGKVGHVNIVPDPDGKVRRIPLIIQQQDGQPYPALSVEVLYTLFHKPLPATYSLIDNKVNLAMRDIPVDTSYFMRLNLSVIDNKPAFLSYGDIIDNSFDPSVVKNKIVLVGMTATGDLDQFSVPNSSVRVPGVYIHAAAIDTILRTQFLTEQPLANTLLVMALLILLCAVMLPVFGTWHWTDILKGTVFIAALLFGYIVVASVMAGQGYVMNILYPAMLLLVLFMADIIYMIVQEQRDKKFVKELFGRYVSPQISKEIVSMANEGELRLGGEEREVTILFADIRNFTTISEKMTPDAVVKMLNTCLPILIDAIVQNGGLVNKFAGDNLMGVWNAPQSQAGHPMLAVKAALEGQRKMVELGIQNPELSNVHFGIGINTGKALAGNIGSQGRAEYTVIGDEVNLASRICSVTPGGEIYVGPETFSQTQRYFNVEPQAPQVFKGKSMPIVVYKVVGWSSQPPQ